MIIYLDIFYKLYIFCLDPTILNLGCIQNVCYNQQ